MAAVGQDLDRKNASAWATSSCGCVGVVVVFFVQWLVRFAICGKRTASVGHGQTPRATPSSGLGETAGCGVFSAAWGDRKDLRW